MGNWKLTAGKLWNAWRDYPRQRRQYAAFPPGRPIFITGTHRSGTTWVAKMLAVPGLWYLHEPFNPNKGYWPESFLYAPPDSTRPDIDSFARSLMNGNRRALLHADWVEHPLMPLRLLPQPVRRIMIKDPLACLLTPYLHQHVDWQTLVLFRHPCGFVSSLLRLKWPTAAFLRELLQRDELVWDHFQQIRPLLKQYSERDGLAAATALHGALNTVLWNTCRDRGIRYARFEDLCEDPLAAFEELFQWFDLPYSESVREQHARLCFDQGNSPADYATHAVQRNSRAMAESWKQQLTAEQIAEVRGVWKQFDVPLYRDDVEWPLKDTQAVSDSFARE